MNEWANSLGFCSIAATTKWSLKHQEPIWEPLSDLLVPVSPTLTQSFPPLAFSPRQWRSWGGCSSNCTWYSHSAAGKHAQLTRLGRHGKPFHWSLQGVCPVTFLVRGRTGRAGQSQATPAGPGEALGLNAMSLPPHHHLSVLFPQEGSRHVSRSGWCRGGWLS